MFRDRKILAVIPARGGSKGIPRKNIRLIGGKPLIAWVIEAAKNSKYIDRLILSSDDEEIIQVARKCGCETPFVRPIELAQDDSSSSDVILHALMELPGYDYVMLLQPTSPLTSPEDIDGCIEACRNPSVQSVVTITESDKSPYWMFKLGPETRLEPLFGESYLRKRRQELPRTFVPNGAIYVSRVEWFRKHKSFYSKDTIGFEMPKDRSIDIDNEMDIDLFESRLKREKHLLKSDGNDKQGF